MNRAFFTVVPLLALSAAYSSNAIAEPSQLTVTGETQFQQTVGYGDLDLRDTRSTGILYRRVMKASKEVCIAAEGPQLSDLSFGIGPSGNCPISTFRAVRPQIVAALERAKAGGSDLAKNFVVSVRRGR